MGLVRQQVAHAQHVAVGRRISWRAAGEQYASGGGQALDEDTAWHASLLLHGSFPQSHGAQLSTEAGRDDHCYVNEQKENEGRESKEVDGPSRLVAAKHIQQEWIRRQ